jgi:hypothetical protein
VHQLVNKWNFDKKSIVCYLVKTPSAAHTLYLRNAEKQWIMNWIKFGKSKSSPAVFFSDLSGEERETTTACIWGKWKDILTGNWQVWAGVPVDGTYLQEIVWVYILVYFKWQCVDLIPVTVCVAIIQVTVNIIPMAGFAYIVHVAQ